MLTRLLKRLGLRRAPETQKYALDSALHVALDSLAEQQQSSPGEMASDLVNEALARRRREMELWRRWQSLSPREQQVAALTCLDYTNPQIAALLGVSVETVRTHTRNVQNKFMVNSKADLRVLLAGWDFSAFEQP